MSNIVTKKLSINKNNIEQYCDAQNVSFNVSDHAWRKWLNGSTDGYVILKSDGKAVLYPTDTAHPFKADSLISASRSAGTCTVDLQFAGTNVHSESYTSGTQKQKSKADITDSAVTNSTKATEIKWHVYGKNGDNQRGDLIELTLYFYQYTMSVNKGTAANGIQGVGVSNAAPYYGDSVTFNATLVQGATWHGWYSDETCTNLVSADQNYTVAPTSDLILYANATIDATLYNCAAVAGTEITSVSVSDYIVPEGGECTFSAQVNEGCSFEAWYSDDTYSTVVSSSNPYTATIIENTTLYAKAHRNSLNMSVGSAEHGTASVSATTVPYGNDVTFTFTSEDETWELYGWYSDSALTQLVSEANPYTFAAIENMTLYPKVGKKRYTIKYGRAKDVYSGAQFEIDIIVVDFNNLTHDEINCLRTGDYDSIDSSKIVVRDSVSDSNILKDVWKTIQCTYGMYVAVYLPKITMIGTDFYSYVTNGSSALTYWPYYWFKPTTNTTISSINKSADHWCNCSAVAKDGIAYAYATTPTLQEQQAVFEAEVSLGYSFQGWYSDEACTTLVSSSNPYKPIAPKDTTDSASQTSLTLYTKATKATYTIGVGTAEHCTTSVSATTAQYGDTVTFSCTFSNRYEFLGWYADAELTQLVASDSVYNHTVTDSITLYPVIWVKNYNMIIHPTGYDEINSLSGITITNIDRLYTNDKSASTYASFTIPNSTSDNPVGIGFYVDGSKFSDMPDNATNIRIGINSTMAMTAPNTAYISETYTAKRNLVDGTPSYAKVGNRVWNGNVIHTGAFTFTMLKSDGGSWNVADLKDGKFGIFLGLYNTSSINRTVNIYNIDISITYNIAEEDDTTTGIYLKPSGTWVEAKVVYKKVNGTWGQQDDPKTLFSGSSTGSESNYIYCGDVSS